jgi:uncharacterized membrane protein YjgN (DUF898 family)
VYLASWPVFAIAAVWVAAVISIGALSPEVKEYLAQDDTAAEIAAADADEDGAAAEDRDADEAEDEDAAKPLKPLPPLDARTLGPLALAAVLTLLCVIRLEFNYKRLLVARARIGNQAGRWKPAYRDFVKVWLTAVGIFLLSLALLGGVSALLFGAAVLSLKRFAEGSPALIFMLVLYGVLAVLLLAVLSSLPARAWREARMFQLVWNNVGFSQIARTRTSLRAGAYTWLRVKNMLLTLLTLGFYRPFARVSEYAAKVGSVTIYLKGDAEDLAGELVKQRGAFGDAAADAIGLGLIG